MAKSSFPGGIAAVFALLLPAAAGAVNGAAEIHAPDRYQAYADVVRVSPRYGWRQVTEPVRQCVVAERPGRYPSAYGPGRRYPWRGGHSERHDRSGGAVLLGGLIGGFIGSRFGDGNGRTALTVAGAALGASIARDRAGQRRDEVVYAYPEERCVTTSRVRRVRGVDGYDVTYRYHGHTFNKWMNTHPGDRIPVRVAVAPAFSQ